MRHLSPHRIADLEAGRVEASLAARWREHIAGCPRCAAAQEKVRAGREAMAAIASAPAPELGWDHIGARIYWSRSTQLRAAGRRRRSRALRWTGAGLAAAGAVAIAAALWLDSPPAEVSAPIASVAPQPAVAAEPAPAVAEPAALGGLVTFATGDAHLDGRPLSFDAVVGEGAVLATGDGRLAVQFSAGSGFSLAAHSRLEVVSFDAEHVELRVDGTVDVDITRRPPGQRFEVVAGDQRVVVRGTAFRVGHQGGALEVTCTRGEVVVTDGAAAVQVRAGERFRAQGAAFADAALRSLPLTEAELAAVEESLRVPLLPAFAGARAMLETTSALEVRAEPGRAVAIDGAVVGEGRFFVRVMRGRHLVAGEGEDGRWVETGAGAAAVAEIAAAPGLAASPSADRRTRRRQLAEAVRAGGVARRCLDPLAKQGLLAGSYALFDVGIAADGSRGHVNVVDSNLSPAIQRCLREAIDAAALGPGPRARVRYRLAY